MRLEITRMYEADLLPPRVSAEHPGDLFHFPEGRRTTVGVSRTGTDREGNPAVLARESTTLDELLSKGDSLDDGCVATGEAERRFSILHRASANLDVHGAVSSLGGSFHRHLLWTISFHIGPDFNMATHRLQATSMALPSWGAPSELEKVSRRPPNKRVNLTVPRVTRLANGGKPRAAGTLGYAQRTAP